MPNDTQITELLKRVHQVEKELRELSARLEPAEARPDAPETPVARRGLLKHVGGMALGVTAAAMAGQALGAAPAAADQGQPMTLGAVNESPSRTSYECFVSNASGLDAINRGIGNRTVGIHSFGDGVGMLGRCVKRAGLIGLYGGPYEGMLKINQAGVGGVGDANATGVMGVSDTGIGVFGKSDRLGVYGQCEKDDGYAVAGQGTSERAVGVGGFSTRNIGVEGRSDFLHGVSGTCYHASSTYISAGVYGVLEEQSWLSLDHIRPAAVIGDTLNHVGVQGVSANGDGVVGTSEVARGGVFAGGAAAIRLKPGTGAGAPAAGETGDLHVDSTGRLWYCRRGGSEANWVPLTA